MIIPILFFENSNAKTASISGVASKLGVPIESIIRVYSRNTGSLICSTRSDKNGHYNVSVPIDGVYTIISIDLEKKFNAVIQDNVVPK